MSERVRGIFTIAVVGALALGCPPDDKKAPAPTTASPTSACTSVGQSCELLPGKLGTCVQNDDCKTGASCFHCQSQH